MRRALIVGIDAYRQSPLNGCVADAIAVAEVLRTNADGSPNWRPELRIGDSSTAGLTRENLRSALAQLFSNCRDHDLLFFFAGHGGQSAWGADLVTQDVTPNSLGVPMNDLMTLANDSPARSVTVILDCCFSGDVGSVPGLQAAGVSDAFRLNRTVLRENVAILAASRGTESSVETNGHGAFTRVLLDGLDGGATDHIGRVTALSLYSYISSAFDAWEQRPLLKANLTEPVVLRIGPPWLEAALLRALPEHFPAEDARVQMTPAHEGEGRPLARSEDGTPEQRQFDYFGRLRNAGLVTTDDRRDHYWVAMESGYVYLTPLGRYFWRLAKRGAL
jgi:Caspase domain